MSIKFQRVSGRKRWNCSLISVRNYVCQLELTATHCWVSILPHNTTDHSVAAYLFGYLRDGVRSIVIRLENRDYQNQ